MKKDYKLKYKNKIHAGLPCRRPARCAFISATPIDLSFLALPSDGMGPSEFSKMGGIAVAHRRRTTIEVKRGVRG